MTSAHLEKVLRQSSGLQKMLHAWAARYTCNPHLQEQLVQATILTLTHDPDLIDERHFHRSLLKILSGIAREKLGASVWRRGPFAIEMYPDGERYVVQLSKGSKTEKMRFINERFAANYVRTLRQRSLVRSEVRRGD